MKPSATGVTFTNVLQGDQYLTNAVAHNGAGLAIGDIDADGWQDLYFCSLEGPNRLYRNLGEWHFEEVDLGAAACAQQLSTGAAFVDADGDGDLDLLVNGIASGTRLFFNDGRGRWTESTASGLSRTASSTSMALADIDGDGDLDLYCAHYIDVMHLADPTTRFGLARKDGQWTVSRVNGQSTRLPRWQGRFEALPDGSVRELPEADALYLNDGNGKFSEVQAESGAFLNERGESIPLYRDWGLAVMFRDINGDSAPDLYVCNDNASPDRFWLNTGAGKFKVADPILLRHTSRSSMGIDFADVNRDGAVDMVVLDMLAREHSKRMMQLVKDDPEMQTHAQADEQPRYNRNMLFLQRPDGTYTEAALMAGIAATDWSWCPLFIDVDLDGYEDLLVSNGFSFDVMDQDSHDRIRHLRITAEEAKRSRRLHPHWPTPNAAFRNRGDGTFEPMATEWRFDHPGISYGMAAGDLDNDGDLDVVINNLNAPAGLYRNDCSAARIAIRLNGAAPNTAGVGAKIRVTASGAVAQTQEMISGGRYMSGDQALRVFAGPRTPATSATVEVTWRNGEQTILTNIAGNRIIEVRQDAAGTSQRATRPIDAEPFFTDSSSLLNHRRIDHPVDDWVRQPSLPKRLSRSGPGVSWYDINGDGWEDLTITSGEGDAPAVFINQTGQGFTSARDFAKAASGQGAVVGWADGRGDRLFVIAESDEEGKSESALAAISISTASELRRWNVGKASLGPLAIADVDGDDDLDLFVGGRFLPGRYPEPVSSFLWLNQDGALQPNALSSEPFKLIGIVNGATFADFDDDGDPDLALAIEWGAIRLYQNQGGKFEVWNSAVQVRTLSAGGAGLERGDAAMTLQDLTGLWTGIATGDFDGDGRLDFAAGNWGRNSSYELFGSARLALFYGDWNADGQVEIVESWLKDATWYPVQDRNWVARSLPDVQLRFPTHAAYGQATVPDLLGARYSQATRIEAAHRESMVFLNRGSHFEAIPLPNQAQLAPVFSVNVADVDGDGIEDLFLSQNFFGTPPQISREDGGRGLWLRGRGDGTFDAVDGSVSGIKAYGEQRGAALSDFDHDGRVDLAISQNNGATVFYTNRRGKPGLRVILDGAAANPDAIGAQLQVIYKNGRKGPRRSIDAGTGYWSQDGATQVLGLAAQPAAVWIRWPGGKEQTVAIKENQTEVRLRR